MNGYDLRQQGRLFFEGCLYHDYSQCLKDHQLKNPFNCMSIDSLYQDMKGKLKNEARNSTDMGTRIL